MARNGSGTYAAPASSWNPPVSGAAISDTDWIALLADLTTALSGSIANDGQTTCSARIPFAAGASLSDGSVGTPGLNFTSDTDNGLYRIGANNWALSAGGTKIVELTSTNAIIRGTATNDSASAGFVGELKTDTVASASALSLTTATPRNIVSVSLTAGDWDVEGTGCFTGAASTTLAYAIASVSATSATLATDSAGGYVQSWYNNVAFFSSSSLALPTGNVQMSLSGTTTVYLVVQASFATSTCTGYGHIRARRVR